jgi:DMSO/TMAO reductase YedYZ molybdopterin-dependent catalytic subunit
MNNHFENWTDKQIKRRTFFSFAAFGLAGIGATLGYKWFRALPETDNGLSSATRKVLSFNEKINAAFFSNQHLVKTYPKTAAAQDPRVNGDVGVDEEIEEADWELEVVHPFKNDPFYVTIDDIKALPKEEIIFDFKCIEGWTEIVHYGGTKLSNFLEKYQLGTKENTEFFKYMGVETPDGKYYVGLDMKSALHPQTLLCYEMNGSPLPPAHGAPLRLIVPVKYGVKNLKCIGKLFLSDTPPRDYWHELGYDYDAAL